MSRMEANKEVRRNLNRHGVDLAYTQYSVAGMEIRLTGWLCKHDASDFNIGQIEYLINDFQRYLPGYSVCGEFDNWKFTTDHVSYLGDSKKTAAEEKQFIDDLNSDYDSEAS